MHKIRTVIVDDEPLARRGIRAHLKNEKDFEVISECRNGNEAVKTIETESPDLVFLDVQMPELDGFGVVNAIGPARMPAVIFVTAYDRYALRAFEVHALDYLLKPFDDDRFAGALQRAKQQIEQREVSELSQRLVALLGDRDGARDAGHAAARPPHLTRLLIKSAGRVFFLKTDEIDWIGAE